MSIETVIKSLEKFEGSLASITANQTEFADRLLSIEQGRSIKSMSHGSEAPSVGLQVVKQFTENAELFAKTKSLRMELKAAGDAVTTVSGRSLVNSGVGFVQGGVLGLQNALPVRAVSATTATEYSRYTGQQGAAAVQAAEGDAKAAVRPDHTLITQNGLTIAGYAKMSRQALTDSAELRRAVEVTLQRSVATAMDVALATGATGFTGGFNALATAVTASVTYTTLVDAVSECSSQMQTAGFVPDVVVMAPAEWLKITTAKSGGDGQYFSGNYLGELSLAMRGLRVVLSPSIPANKALVLDSTHSELLISDSFSIEIGYTNDDFTKNLVVLLGEMRVIPVFRTVGSARLVALAEI